MAVIIVFFIPMLVTALLSYKYASYREIEDRFKPSPFFHKNARSYYRYMNQFMPTTFLVMGGLLIICCGVLGMSLPFGKHNAPVYLSFWGSVGWAVVLNLFGFALRWLNEESYSRYDKF